MSEYTEDMILDNANNYIVLLNEDIVIGCVSLKKNNWYSYEVMHMVVIPPYRNMGYGKRLIDDCITRAKSKGCKILQCTIKNTNEISKKVFLNKDFRCTSQFVNNNTGNTIEVYQLEIIY